MTYALWETRTLNLVESFDSLHEALELVLDGIERNGPNDTDTLALDVDDEEGNVTPIADGKELAELARRELGAMTTAP